MALSSLTNVGQKRLQVSDCTVEPKINNLPHQFTLCFTILALECSHVGICSDVIFRTFHNRTIFFLSHTIDLLYHEMQHDDWRPFLHGIRLHCQNFRIHNTQDVRINLHTFLFPCGNLRRHTLEHTVAKPVFELIGPSLQEPLHNLWQGVFHHVTFPIIQSEFGIQFAQFLYGNGFGSFGSECVVYARNSINPRILTSFPSLPCVFFDFV
mmetsp:Transcript_13882/g.38395  ORF Transcript_13882/g.38395 Transcript_13882/m.38395 type:complete len:210 (+) Transcript_13882:619-1248(+)